MLKRDDVNRDRVTNRRMRLPVLCFLLPFGCFGLWAQASEYWWQCPPGFTCDSPAGEKYCTPEGCKDGGASNELCKGGDEIGHAGEHWCGSGDTSHNCGTYCYYNEDSPPNYVCAQCTDDGMGGCDCDFTEDD